MMPPVSKLRCHISDSDFRCVAIEIRMLVNMSSESKPVDISVFKYAQPCAVDDGRTMVATPCRLVER